MTTSIHNKENSNTTKLKVGYNNNIDDDDNDDDDDDDGSPTSSSSYFSAHFLTWRLLSSGGSGTSRQWVTDAGGGKELDK